MTAVLTLAAVLTCPATPPEPVGDPFDLTFVPADAPARLIGLRPAALTAMPGAADQADPMLTAAVAQVVTHVGGSGEAAKLPPLADLSQVLCEGIRLDFPTADRKGQISTISGWYVLKTADPFDWAGLAAAWFPAGVTVEHAGRSYRRCPLKAEAFGATDGQSVELVFFAADTRTVVIAFDEVAVKRLIDRPKTGERVTPPPLWGTVERHPLALAASLADRSWLTVPDELPPDRPGLVPFARLVRAAGGLAIGAVPAGDGLRLTAVVVADDLPGAADALRAAAARTGRRPWVRVAGSRATASVLVPMADVMAAVAGGDGDD